MIKVMKCNFCKGIIDTLHISAIGTDMLTWCIECYHDFHTDIEEYLIWKGRVIPIDENVEEKIEEILFDLDYFKLHI